MKVLLKRFQLNGHTIGFHPHTHRVLSTDSFSCGCRRVNGPYWGLEFRFYSSSYNFKSSGLRRVPQVWDGVFLEVSGRVVCYLILESQYLDKAHMRCYALASPYTFVICSVGPVADSNENNCISVLNS